MSDLPPPQQAVLAVGVSGCARLREKLGHAEAMRAVERCMSRIERVVTGVGGHVGKLAGDEMTAVFYHVDEALQAAIEMQQRVADLPPVSGVKLGICLGLASGSVAEDAGEVGGETVTVAAMLARQAKVGQILADAGIIGSMSGGFKTHVREFKPGAGTPVGDRPVVEVIMPVSTPGPGSQARKEDSADNPGVLRLKYAGQTLLLDGQKSSIMMGRDDGCDLVVHDRRASRRHALIERRGNTVVFIDKSTNGSYIVFAGEQQQFLRHRQCVLHDKGLIFFAAPSTQADAEFVEFELV